MSTAPITPVVMPYAPAASNCPICGRSLLQKQPKMLNGVPVCAKCVNSFANRRGFAWIIDSMIQVVLSLMAGIAFAIIYYSLYPGAIHLQTTTVGYDIMVWVISIPIIAAFLAKDGFTGRSPGKMMLGLRTIDATTYKPISFGRSMKRNLPTVLPFVPLILALQLSKGWRWGDRWANTRVVWIRYQHRLPFDQRGRLCTKCGYDLTGNESGRCPECGTGVPVRPAAAVSESFNNPRVREAWPVEQPPRGG